MKSVLILIIMEIAFCGCTVRSVRTNVSHNTDLHNRLDHVLKDMDFTILVSSPKAGIITGGKEYPLDTRYFNDPGISTEGYDVMSIALDCTFAEGEIWCVTQVFLNDRDKRFVTLKPKSSGRIEKLISDKLGMPIKMANYVE